MRLVHFCIVMLLSFNFVGQGIYAPPAGMVGTTAIHKDSSIFVGWSANCSVQRGYVQITDTTQGKASAGATTSVSGKADGQIVSLGDSGVAIITLTDFVTDGAGHDFAIFENGFSNTFLELAFVEVSSDGVNYVRFPNYYTDQDTIQITTFGAVDATHVHNLAGKYRANFGTPFDLADIPDTNILDKFNISHIKIIDVIGSIDYPSFDSEGRKINDPFPTNFASGGFDLDAVGIINVSLTSSINELANEISIYPNPVRNYINIKAQDLIRVRLTNAHGQVLTETVSSQINMEEYPAGIYFLTLVFNNQLVTKQIYKQ